MSGRIRLSSAARRSILAHCDAASGREACGLLLGVDGPVVRIDLAVPLANRALRRDRFRVPAEEVWHGALAHAGPDRALVGVYHSHPDGNPRPSRRDLDHAWGDLLQLIVVRSGDLPRLACWGVGEGAPRRLPLSEESA